MSTSGDPRTEQLRTALAALSGRVEAACRNSARSPGEVTTVLVTKTYPVQDVRRLHALGVRVMGESRDQEASAKAEECADLAIEWHLVGRLQTNKARSVARYVHAVHSVDRLTLVAALDRAAEAAGRRLDVFVQVNLDAVPTAERGGVAISAVPEVSAAVAQAPSLRLLGLMAVGPRGQDPQQPFARLQEASHQLRREHPQASAISAGMSGDLEVAIAHGATHLRVGSAVLGERPTVGYGRSQGHQ